MGTFRLPNFTTIEAPLNTLSVSPTSTGLIGGNLYTFDSQVRAGMRQE
jgi:hypothetical protein